MSIHETAALLPGPTRELTLWDKANPRSVINLLSPAIADKMTEAVQSKQMLFEMDEKTLWQTLRKGHATPTPTDNRLRMKFWVEYDRCQSEGDTKMHPANIVGGVTSYEFFYQHYLKQPEKIAWLLCPPANYMIMAEEALGFGLEQMREILELPIQDLGGKVNTSLGNLKLSIVKMLDERVKGAIVQKTENRSLSVALTTHDRKMVAGAALAMSAGDLDKRIKELERRNRAALHLPEMIIETNEELNKLKGRQQ